MNRFWFSVDSEERTRNSNRLGEGTPPLQHASEEVGQDFLLFIFPNQGSKSRWGCEIKGRKTANFSKLGLKNNSPYRQKTNIVKSTHFGFERPQRGRFPRANTLYLGKGSANTGFSNNVFSNDSTNESSLNFIRWHSGHC